MSTPWIRKLERDIHIASLIVIEGNVHDVYWTPNQPYQILPDLLASLAKSHFSQVVHWNQITGVNGVSFDDWQAIQSVACSNTTDSTSSGVSENPFAELEAEDDRARGTIDCDLADMLSIVATHLSQTTAQRRLFILDFTELLFNGHNALSEADRANIQRLVMGVRDFGRHIADVDFLQQQQNVAICITTNGALPISLSEGLSEVSHITIPLPHRAERATLINKHLPSFRVEGIHTSQVREDLIDGTDQYTFRDLWQVAKLSTMMNSSAPPMKLDNLLHLFKHGEQDSPWEQLNRSKLGRLAETLQERVKGQPDAVEKVVRVVKRAFTGLAGIQHSGRQQRPKGVLFFVGPTGVGKTELAKSLAHFLFGEDDACIRFDMSEYNHEHSDQRLVGAPPGYVGYEEGGQLTNAIQKRPFSVLLFDEIEKAHPRILDKFLQIVDDGRLTDGRGQTVFFSDAIIIFTSNIGAADVEPSGHWPTVRAQFIDRVQRHFRDTLKRPELLNRIGDNIMPFNFIDDPESRQAIARLKLKPIEQFMKDRYGVTIRYRPMDSFLLTDLTQAADIRNGGRGIGNVVETMVVDPLSEFLFDTSHQASTAEYLDIIKTPDEAIQFEWA